MDTPSKIDVLDLLINIVKEHEVKMDGLVERLEIVSRTIQGSPELLARYEPGQDSLEVPDVSSILVVDDDSNLADSFKIVLQSVGFDVDVAPTGAQALYRTSIKKYDLILLDINLPDMLGDEVAERLQEENKDIDIIMITGYSNFKEEIENSGNLNVLLKPIPPEELVIITKNKLNKKA